jgi:Uma2 family endonuclease
VSAVRKEGTEHRMSVQAYFDLEDSDPDTRYEYLDGNVVMMSGGSLNHSLIQTNSIGFIVQALRDSPCRVFSSDARVKLSATRYVYPDVTISCAQQDNQRSVVEPNLVIEVMSPSTAGYDSGLKLRYYRKCSSITTILLVELDMPSVEVYRRQSSNTWTITIYDLDSQIILDALDVTIPVAEIYRNVTFTPTPEDSEE